MALKTGVVGNLEGLDVGVIVVYFVIVIGFGLWVCHSCCSFHRRMSRTGFLCSIVLYSTSAHTSDLSLFLHYITRFVFGSMAKIYKIMRCISHSGMVSKRLNNP